MRNICSVKSGAAILKKNFLGRRGSLTCINCRKQGQLSKKPSVNTCILYYQLHNIYLFFFCLFTVSAKPSRTLKTAKSTKNNKWFLSTSNFTDHTIHKQ